MAPKKGGLKVGAYVWVKDPAIAGTDLFTKGAILAIDDKGKATVETSNGIKTQELILPLSECHMPHPADDVPDHCQLMYLSQPTLLENTRVRFMADKIYTYVGNILVVVNPFRRLEHILGPSIMAQCKGKKLWNASCGPHSYAVAEQVCDAAPQPRAMRVLGFFPASLAPLLSVRMCPKQRRRRRCGIDGSCAAVAAAASSGGSSSQQPPAASSQQPAAAASSQQPRRQQRLPQPGDE
jgi:hypothetical protein